MKDKYKMSRKVETQDHRFFRAVFLVALIFFIWIQMVSAKGVLRLDEVAVGEIDPAKATDFADTILMFNLYDTLVFPRQGSPGYDPHLAKSWKGSGVKYTFKLRSDVKFIDGSSMTAEDVVFSLERMKAMGKGLSYLFDNVVSAKALNKTTVEFRLKQPSSPFVASLVRLPILSKSMVMANLGSGKGKMKDWGESWLSTHTAGTGAYKIVSHNPQEETVMERNKNYFLRVSDKAPDTVRFRYSLETATVRTLIAQGKHDISSQWLPPEVMKALYDSGNQLLYEKGGGAFYLKMNNLKKPFDDVNCRLALANAFDYDSAIKIIQLTDKISYGTHSTGAIPVGMYGANPANKPLKRDMAAAKRYLSKCGVRPQDFNLDIVWIAEVPIEERFALLMQANFSELGITSKIKKIPWALFSEEISKPESIPGITLMYVNSVTGDPDTLLYSMYHSSVAGTWQSLENLNDPKVDKLLEEGRLEAKEKGRIKIYSDLNKRLMEISPSIYAYDLQSVFVASKRVKVPALSDFKKAFSVSGAGFIFRLMEMKN